MPVRTSSAVARRVRAVSNVAGVPLDEGWNAPLALGLTLYALGYTLLTLLHPFDEETFLALSDVGGVLPPMLAAILAFSAAENSLGQVRVAWTLIGAACLSWGLGEIVWTVYEVGLDREAPFPSLADLGYLGMLPLMALGLTLLSSSRRRLANSRPALDGLAVVLAFTAFVWYLVLQPTYTDSGASALEKLIGGFYPIGDLVLLYVVATAVERQLGFRDSLVLATLFAAILFLVAADVGFAYLTLEDEYTSRSVVNVGWPLGFLLLGYAAALSARWSLGFAEDEGAESKRRWREALPAVLIPPMAALALAAFAHEPRSTSIPLLAMTGFAAATVTARIAIGFGALREFEASRDKLSLWLGGPRT